MSEAATAVDVVVGMVAAGSTCSRAGDDGFQIADALLSGPIAAEHAVGRHP